jgi:hypothetical protein
MIRQPFLYVLFFCLLICCTWALAQDGSTQKDNDEKDRCSEYKMRVVKPSNEIDYKLRITKPRKDIDFKGKIVDPCEKPDAKPGKRPSSPENEKHK